MLNRIAEIRSCINHDLYEAALALALTLPDICGKVEYPNAKVGPRYRDWIINFVDNNVFYDSCFDIINLNQTFEPLTASDIYNLRCSFLHNGDDDLQQGVRPRIDQYQLVKPGVLGVDNNGKDYGYMYQIREENGQQIHLAKINIKYFCEMLCDYAEKYYHMKNPEDFEEHTWTLG